MSNVKIFRFNLNAADGVCIIPFAVKKVLKFGKIGEDQPCVWAEVYPSFQKPEVGKRTVIQCAVTGGSPPTLLAQYLGTEQFGTVTVHGYVIPESDIHEAAIEALGEVW